MGTAGVNSGVGMKWNEYTHREALVEAVALRIHGQLNKALAEPGSVSVALSGGGTPMPIYARLAQMPLDWSRVVCIPTDERWVARDHAANNAREIRQHLSVARIEDLVPELVSGAPKSTYASEVLGQLPSPFEVAIVGMGADAHFASLFPHAVDLADGLDLNSSLSALAIVPDPLPPEAPFGRISLSLAKLLEAHAILLVITGETKRAVLEQAMADDVDVEASPIAALLRAAGPSLEVFWSP